MDLLKKNYTRISNQVLKHPLLDPYEKIIFCLIASCNPSFPSYEKLIEWSGMSRDKVAKSLRRLEELKLIVRFKKGRGTLYETRWIDNPKEREGLIPIKFKP